jgi:hypothetical protein
MSLDNESIKTIQFESANINSSHPLIIVKQNINYNKNKNDDDFMKTRELEGLKPSEDDDNDNKYETTLYTPITMTEYEMFYAIIPLYEIKESFTKTLNGFIEYLNTQFPMEIVVKIIKNYIEIETPLNIEESHLLNKIPIISIQELINTNPNIIDISSNSLYIMDNRKVKINKKQTYTKEYIKELVLNGKLSIGSSDHFRNSNIISFLDKEDSDYIKSFFRLTESESERWKPEWRGFTNYL